MLETCKIINKLFKILGLAGLLISSHSVFANISFEKQVKISDRALFFDGDKVPNGTPNKAGYDYFFGNKISPHGDCIQTYQHYVFMTWYRGGESDRHVMLSRYNKQTGVTKTIKFPHRHTGYLNQPHIGESHNTIAVGVSPIDGTIHLLYDMHSYSENRPSDGSFADDYFRYSYSEKNAATVPDSQFTIDRFVNSNAGNYKHLQLRNGVNYKSLTYPNFFTNKKGELFVWIREGGNTNGAYKFAKYDGNSWSGFTQFNILNAKRFGNDYNWGLYGDIKFESGKMRIGFSRRANISGDKYRLNNGFYYGYSDDPLGATKWKDANGKGFSLPLIDPETLKISEPADVLNVSGKDSVNMTRGSDWTVTDRGDIHFVTTVSGGGIRKNVHTYRKSGESQFRTSTSFPGGNLYTYNNQVYLIGLSGGRVFIEKTDGGTNNWKRVYTAPTSGKKFRHGVVHIHEGKLYYYLMEQSSGSAQPIYLQIIDLGLDAPVEEVEEQPEQSINQKPNLSFLTPTAGATFDQGQSIKVEVRAADPDAGDEITSVRLFLNGEFVREERVAPYIWLEKQDPIFGALPLGRHTLRAVASDSRGEMRTQTIEITVNPLIEPDGSTVEFPDEVPEETEVVCYPIQIQERAEINLSATSCIEFDRWLSGSTLQVWDSDITGACDFRGTLTSMDGSGQLIIDSNYVTSDALKGKRFNFTPRIGTNCNRVKVRAF